jgi:hypothetical protein
MKRKILTVFVLLLAIVQATFANTKQSTDKVVICGISLGMKPYQVFDILGKPNKKEGDLASEKGGVAIYYGISEKSNFTMLYIKTKNGKADDISLHFYDSEENLNFKLPDSNIPIDYNFENMDNVINSLGKPVFEDKNSYLFPNGVEYYTKDNRSWIATSDFLVKYASLLQEEKNKPNYGLVVSESSFKYSYFPDNKSKWTSCTVTGFIKNFRGETLDVKVRVILRNPNTNEFIYAFEKVIRNVKPDEKTLFSIEDYDIYVPNNNAVYSIELSEQKL